MQEEGRQITCDRCGKTGFFRIMHNLMKSPEGSYYKTEIESHENWGKEEIDGKIYDFCPSCNGQYMRMVKDFANPINSIAERN